MVLERGVAPAAGGPTFPHLSDILADGGELGSRAGAGDHRPAFDEVARGRIDVCHFIPLGQLEQLLGPGDDHQLMARQVGVFVNPQAALRHDLPHHPGFRVRVELNHVMTGIGSAELSRYRTDLVRGREDGNASQPKVV